MTRINLVEPETLCREHLIAEYHELPRIFGLVKKAIERGETPNDKRNPSTYRLGKGHVRFFYPRLGFLVDRQNKLVNECKKRGYNINFGGTETLTKGIPKIWFGNYKPTKEALAENKARIDERLEIINIRKRKG